MSRLALALLYTVGALFAVARSENGSVTFDDIPSQIEYANSLYENGEFLQAAELFDALAPMQTETREMSSLRFMEGKAWYYGGELDRAEATFEGIARGTERELTAFSAASYYFLGRIAFDRKSYLEAASEFTTAFQLAHDPELKELCYNNVVNLSIGYLSNSEQKSLFSGMFRIDQAFFSDLIYNTARKYHQLGLHRKAERVLDIHDSYAGGGDTQIRKLASDVERELAKSLELALLLPLTGDLAAYGRQMDAAARLAVQTYGEHDVTVNIKQYDTFGNSIVAAQLARDVTSSGVSAMIGPLTSQEAVGAAPYSDFWSVPMILPAASEKGITSISSRVFQLTPTPEVMGRRLGEAVESELGLDSIAILAPNDSYGRQITDGFKRVLEDMNVEVFFEKHYARGTTDYRRFMLDLKEAVLPDSFDSTIFLDETGDTLETEEVPVTIPALFVPGYAEELDFIIPQLRFYRIETILLGSEDLGVEDIVSLSDTKLYPSMFVSRATRLDSDTTWIKFEYLFAQESNTPPTHVAGMTFDAVRLALKAANAGGYTADGIAEGFNKLGRVQGVTGPFEFNEFNENVSVPVYIIFEGQLEKWTP